MNCTIDVEDGSICSQCTLCTKQPWKGPDINSEDNKYYYFVNYFNEILN